MFSFIGRRARRMKLSYETAEEETLKIVNNGERQHPSWINDRLWQKTLVESTMDEAQKSGMSKLQAENWLSQQSVAERIITFIAQLEKAKFSRLDQVSGAMEYTGKLASAQIQDWGR